jgi:quinohemoprotein ethanol dehydrogenase
MLKRRVTTWALFLPLLFLLSCNGSKPVNDAGNWLMHGRTYNAQRFSPLKQINEKTVAKLGLAWSQELDTTRGLEATPLVEDGVIYTTGTWSKVYAFDARTGKSLWTYDPEVPRQRAYFICCDVVNRGVALYQDKVYVGTLDARLIALDKHSGKPVWSEQTADTSKPYSITSAPLIARGMVIIGNSGGEYGVRGYITAYDAETGKMLWRTYTVPGDPAKGFESAALERAAKTWSGEWWKTGGGGPPWGSVVYDPELDLLYFGTGNPTPWYHALRDGGDNLYTDSILAVHASSGKQAWYFQTTPGDSWDYDATQPLLQADLSIGGRMRKVIMQANKNGFFYVLDRQTGEFLSGTQFVRGVNWATGLDAKTGRPVETSIGTAGLKPVIVSPSANGAHNWQPMAFSPATGLVYLPAKVGTKTLQAPDRKWKYNPDRDNLGMQDMYDGLLDAKLEKLPAPSGELLAWDPVRREAAWRVKDPVLESGGVLATAGNLVFQGRGDGVFAAYRATDGKQLWSFDAGTGILAPPVTYLVEGVQYVSVMAGWGGTPGLMNFPGEGPVKPGYGRILTFALGRSAKLSVPEFGHQNPPVPAITARQSPRLVRKGGMLFNSFCMECHGINAVASSLPDLRYADRATLMGIQDIVLGGRLAPAGMPSFKKILTPEQVQAIRAYIISRAQESAKAAKHPREQGGGSHL